MDRRVIDAAVRFAPTVVPADAPVVDHIDLVRETLKNQPQRFLDYIDRCDQRAVDAVAGDLKAGMEISVLERVKGEEVYGQDEEFGVYYELNRGVYRPRLHVTIDGIERAKRIIEPIFSNLETGTNMQVAGAVSMVAWMGLAKWLFDKIDPRARDDYELNGTGSVELARLAGVSEDEFDDDLLRETKIEEALLVYRYRFMGALGYAGVVNGIPPHLSGNSLRENVAIFKSIYQSFYDEATAQANPDSVDPISFALARPLQPQGVPM